MLKMPTLDIQSSPVDARAETKVAAQDVNVYYGDKRALRTCR